jgi:formylglycine-generating enzyme required for sulfatase activity
MKAFSLQKRQAHNSFGKPLFRLLKALVLFIFWASQPSASQAAGVTIITHGFHSGTTGWVDEMMWAMYGRSDFPGTRASIYTVYVVPTENSLEVTCSSLTGWDPLSTSDSGEIFILLNWSSIDEGGFGTDVIAEAIVPKLLSPSFVPGLGKRLVEFPIHLVGHSRGGSLVTAIASLLGENGVLVDQVTTLDPHPVTYDEHAPGDFDRVAIYRNVVFADNYYRQGGVLAPNGYSVAGATNIDLTDIVMGGGFDPHTDVHTYYHGTIDTALSFLGPVDGRYISNSWYALPTGPRDSVGYLWSRKVGAQRPLVGVSQDFGGSASRETLNLSAANWPNVVITNAGPLSLLAGQSITLSGFNQDCDSPHTITFYLDTDRNPYNSGLTQLGSPLPRSASGTVVSALPTQTLTIPAGMTSGTYYLCATATDGTRTRYHYFGKSPVTVMQTLTKPVVHSPARGAGGQFSFRVSCLPSLFYYVEASTNLRDWEIVLSTNATTTAFIYSEANVSSRPQRFFRVSVFSSPTGMALIPAGDFAMGNSKSPSEGNANELLHTNGVSAFYMDQAPVTKTLWNQVRTWGLTNGYTDLPVGSAKGDAHPIQSISWYAAVKWCNARSQMENRGAVYYTSASQSTIFRTGTSDITSACVKWATNGYRLPTEAEWEKAARGGLVGMRFPWGDIISHSLANYNGSTATNYDLSAGYHPTFNTNGMPYTSPPGFFSPNGYGLYDMAGNVLNWCWDRSGSYSATYQIDPKGIDSGGSGAARVARGGGWSSEPYWCRVAVRDSASPSGNNYAVGFRCARSSP